MSKNRNVLDDERRSFSLFGKSSSDKQFKSFSSNVNKNKRKVDPEPEERVKDIPDDVEEYFEQSKIRFEKTGRKIRFTAFAVVGLLIAFEFIHLSEKAWLGSVKRVDNIEQELSKEERTLNDLMKKNSIKEKRSKSMFSVIHKVPNGEIVIYKYSYDNNVVSGYITMSDKGFQRAAVFRFADCYYDFFFRNKGKSNNQIETLKPLVFDLRQNKEASASVISCLKGFAGDESASTRFVVSKDTFLALKKKSYNEDFFQLLSLCGYIPMGNSGNNYIFSAKK